MGPALLIRYHRHQFWPGGLSLLNRSSIDASQLPEAGKITDPYLLERDQDSAPLRSSWATRTSRPP
jgi:hypothetical protein